MGRRRFAGNGQELRLVDGHVGERMRLRRGMLGLTQTELGSLLGLSYQQVQKYECGANSLSAGRLWQVSRVLDVPVSFLFDLIPAAIEVLAVPGGPVGVPPPPDARDLVDLAVRLQRIADPRLRRQVIELVGLLADTAEQALRGGPQAS